MAWGSVNVPGGSTQGTDGKSAYEIAVQNGCTGSVTDWLASLKGAKGDKGDKGDPGAIGPAGPGLPAGGTVGQVPVKESAADYATLWKTLTAADVGAAPVNNPVFTNSVSMNRKTGTKAGSSSTALGRAVEASGYYSHAEGAETIAEGDQSHAEGYQSAASGKHSHAEGNGTAASGESSHAEGYRSEASGDYSHAEGSGKAAANYAHAEGAGCEATGIYSHAEGRGSKASGLTSHAGGDHTVAAAECQTTIGAYNIESNSSSDKFIVGKGNGIRSANCFRVTHTGVYADGAHNTTGADYAEMFEWADGNPDKQDRCGSFVTLDGSKIRLAGSEDDFILGIVSGNPSVVGDVHDDQWQGMYLYDIFGRPLWEDVDVPAVTEEVEVPAELSTGYGEEQTGWKETVKETRTIIPAHTEHRQKLNPAHDDTQTYIPRSQRPEWATVGMMGKLVLIDDGTCEVNGWAKPGENGIGTKSEIQTKFRVMERLDEIHVRVLIL